MNREEQNNATTANGANHLEDPNGNNLPVESSANAINSTESVVDAINRCCGDLGKTITPAKFQKFIMKNSKDQDPYHMFNEKTAKKKTITEEVRRALVSKCTLAGELCIAEDVRSIGTTADLKGNIGNNVRKLTSKIVPNADKSKINKKDKIGNKKAINYSVVMNAISTKCPDTVVFRMELADDSKINKKNSSFMISIPRETYHMFKKIGSEPEKYYFSFNQNTENQRNCMLVFTDHNIKGFNDDNVETISLPDIILSVEAIAKTPRVCQDNNGLIAAHEDISNDNSKTQMTSGGKLNHLGETIASYLKTKVAGMKKCRPGRMSSFIIKIFENNHAEDAPCDSNPCEDEDLEQCFKLVEIQGNLEINFNQNSEVPQDEVRDSEALSGSSSNLTNSKTDELSEEVEDTSDTLSENSNESPPLNMCLESSFSDGDISEYASDGETSSNNTLFLYNFEEKTFKRMHSEQDMKYTLDLNSDEFYHIEDCSSCTNTVSVALFMSNHYT